MSAEEFAKLSQGQHPNTGERLVQHRRTHEYKNEDGKTVKTMEHRAGWDAELDELERYVRARIGRTIYGIDQ